MLGVVDYDGATAVVGGPALRRDAGPVVLFKLAVGALNNNVYVAACRATGAAVLIDPSSESDRIARLLDDVDVDTQAIVITHRHSDHVGALPAMHAVTGAPVYAGRADAGALGISGVQPLDHEQMLRIGCVDLNVVQLRGHTPGGIALWWHGDHEHVHLITGDSLFPGGVGKTRCAEDFVLLLSDVEERLFERFDDAFVYPGHGADTTLAAERPALPEWRARGW